MPAAPIRHVDPTLVVGHYARRSLVCCPNCGCCAVAASGDGWFSSGRFFFRSARVTCPLCAFSHAAQHVGSLPEIDHWLGPAVASPAYVRCPTCGARLDADLRHSTAGAPRPRTARVTCPVGGHEVEVGLAWEPDRSRGPLDPMFGLPLWLHVPCSGETLWAFNAAHVAALRAYVAADLRERDSSAHRSMLARLPKWMTSAKNRAAVLRGLDRLAAKLLEGDRP